MLIVQHIWSRWTKASRGADRPLQRPRLADSYPLPPASQAPGALLRHLAYFHEIRSVESDRFEVRETIRNEMQTERSDGVLEVRWVNDGWLVFLDDPSPYRRQTKWPRVMPSPLFVLKFGKVALIDWNARFRFSLFGSNRSRYYEQHRYWLAELAEPEPDPFGDPEIWKHVDLRTEIY